MSRKDPITEMYRESSKSPKRMFKESMNELHRAFSKGKKKKAPGMPSKKEMERHDRAQTAKENYRVREHNKLHRKKK